jgi:hypothetical protein
MKRFIQIPHFVFPSNFDEIVANQKPRPLDICHCKHVKCSCGNCHSQICAEPCLYESGGEVGVPTPDADGKVWCEECKGMYLPHEH